MFVTSLPVVDLIAARKLRALAVTAPKRIPILGNVPTIVEQGYPDLIVEDWVGFSMKTGTPDAVIAQLNAAINRALMQPDVRAAFAKLGAEPAGGTTAEYGALVNEQLSRWTKIVNESGDKDAVIPEVANFKVTLLGTGTPIPSKDRFGPSTLIEAGGQKLLIDAGRGATIRLAQLQVPIGHIDALLLTHFHSDHTVGIPDLWLTGWLESYFGQRQTPFRVIGPRGAQLLMSNIERAYAADIAIRLADEKLDPRGIAITVQEYEHDGIVYNNGGVTVTAFEVDHGDLIKPSFGYCIDYAGKRVVISGDTRFNENVIKYGSGADVLVHEVAIARPDLLSEPHIQRIMAHHTTPREAGMIFAHANPKLALFTHIVFLASPSVLPATVADLITETRQTYSGPLEVGEDLLCVDVGDTISVKSRS